MQSFRCFKMLGNLVMLHDANFKKFMLGKDTIEEFSFPSRTIILLFDRSKRDRFGSLHNELSSTVPVKLFEPRASSSNRVILKMCGGIPPEASHCMNAYVFSLIK